jgi:hypothetical protein
MRSFVLPPLCWQGWAGPSWEPRAAKDVSWSRNVYLRPRHNGRASSLGSAKNVASERAQCRPLTKPVGFNTLTSTARCSELHLVRHVSLAQREERLEVAVHQRGLLDHGHQRTVDRLLRCDALRLQLRLLRQRRRERMNGGATRREEEAGGSKRGCVTALCCCSYCPRPRATGTRTCSRNPAVRRHCRPRFYRVGPTPSTRSRSPHWWQPLWRLGSIPRPCPFSCCFCVCLLPIGRRAAAGLRWREGADLIGVAEELLTVLL